MLKYLEIDGIKDARSTAVAVGGYLAKRSHQTMNTVEAAEAGSDCGTKIYMEIILDKQFKNEYMYRYILDNGQLVLLTPDNFKNYEGMLVKMRSAIFCHQEEPYYCSKCLGEQPYMFGLTKFGLAIARASNNLLNLQLKRFHSSKVNVSTIDYRRVLNWKK